MNRLGLWLGSILVIGAVFGIGGTLGWVKYSEIAAAMAADEPPEQPIAVSLAQSTTVTYRASTTVIGTVLAPESILLSNEIAGTVVALGFKSGDIVAANQKLVELDTRVEQAQLKSASARLKTAQSTLGRIRQAATNRAVSAVEVEEAESVFMQAEAEVLQLEAVIAKKTLVAPFPARIGLSNTHVGQFLPSGSEIVSLQSIDTYVNVDFMAPQSAADYIAVGNEVKLVDDSGTYAAKVSAIDSQADRSSRNLMVRAKLEPVPPQLLPNDSVRVSIEYGPVLDTAAVPVEALRRAPMNSFVYLAEKDAEGNLRARECSVKVGQMIGPHFSILSGLEPGVTVVADGSFKVRGGALLAPVDLSGKATPADTSSNELVSPSLAAPAVADPQETTGK